MLSAPGAVSLAQAGSAEELAACGPANEASSLCLAVYRATGNDFLAAVADTVVVKPAKVLLIILLAFVATRLIGRGIKRFVAGMGRKAERKLGSLRQHAPAALLKTDETVSARAAQRAETIGALLRSTGAFAVWTVAVFMVLGELGLNLGPLIAGAGIVGIALGFGAQNLVRDFISGIFMLVEDQYGVGDVIDAGPASGTVEAVSLRTTRLRDIYGVVWHIPNGKIDRIGNKSQKWSRALLDVGVPYDTDIDAAGEVIKRALDEAWRSEEWRNVILEEPELWGAEDLGPDGITIRMVVKTLPSEQFKVARYLRARIKAALDEAGIDIPFPQREVWHRSRDDRRDGKERRKDAVAVDGDGGTTKA
ncbi:MAG TPA: mechanosensitive ion channel family protein [Acidimicrobiales bacterium]|nr:mechanosensitive ion channel family protein [Acidimicrobiales bacterium]